MLSELIVIIIFLKLSFIVTDLVLQFIRWTIHLNFHGLLARHRISDVELLELLSNRRGSLGHNRRKRRLHLWR